MDIRYITFANILLLGMTFDVFGYQPILHLGINFYLVDIFLLLLLAQLVISLAGRRSLILPTSLHLILFANLFIGVSLVGIAFLQGQTPADILGGFRRYYIYPLTFFVGYGCVRTDGDLRLLSKVFQLTVATVVAIAFFRTYFGLSWGDMERFESFDVRPIGYFSGVIILFGIGVVIGQVVSRGHLSVSAIVQLVLMYTAIIVSGWRLLWVSGFLLPLLMVFVHSGLGFSKFLRFSAVILSVFVGVVIFLPLVFPFFLDLLSEKVLLKVLGYQIQDEIRLYAWSTAFQKFLQSPLVGAGLGEESGFYGYNSGGERFYFHITYHSILFELLAKTGLFGTVPFLFFVVAFLKLGFSRLRLPDKSVIVTGIFIIWCAALLIAFFQPALSSPGPIVVFYLSAGILFRFIKNETIQVRREASE
jgi:O-antigen ligase